ncbi:CapA family protein [Pseudomonas sp. TCU-HL1]|uniref:CapA family protein n=1 Tax=Pseudomonas sp. TCU-HL1 TaxID=1856685 RepID=UPI00083E66EB|nr:CapA family protein [Pseudomonas sp. TCU-HL1]AOE82993.1 poly-gamma-glutamate biosynthesis protein [Pseudomonas sp. TCU-HL1]
MPAPTQALTLFLAGDVMTARGIDALLPHPGDPLLYEPYVKDTGGYVRLAERLHGPLPRPVDYPYIWGDALAELEQRQPQVRLINLETAVTRRGTPEDKGINYRMTPENFPAILAAGVNCCALANNHVLDWGRVGLTDTLAALARNGVCGAGAGRDLRAAEAPAALPLADGSRLLVFGLCTPDCGVPPEWAARSRRSGVAWLPELSTPGLAALTARIQAHKQPGDRVIVSIHWGGNWGFDVPPEQVRFAHGLIDDAGVDLVHGHSSHHIKGLELYRERLILYGCGDLLNDYEGIQDYGPFHGELGLLYFPTLDASGRLLSLELVPTRIRRFRIERAGHADRRWVRETLQRECSNRGCTLQPGPDHDFTLAW